MTWLYISIVLRLDKWSIAASSTPHDNSILATQQMYHNIQIGVRSIVQVPEGQRIGIVPLLDDYMFIVANLLSHDMVICCLHVCPFSS